MAGFDEPQKIVTGLQLLQAGVIDTETLQDNIDGLENIQKVQERIRKGKPKVFYLTQYLLGQHKVTQLLQWLLWQYTNNLILLQK